MNLKIYLAHPITGGNGDEILNYYDQLHEQLRAYGYDVLQPMTGKGYLRTERGLPSSGYTNPVSSNHAIFERDMWMVSLADVMLVDLTGSTKISIGCLMELSAAAVLHKHTILVLPPENVHHHAFVLEASDVIFQTMDQAIDYLVRLARQEA